MIEPTQEIIIPHFNAFDIGVLGLIGLSGAIGLFRGFTREALGLSSWIGAGLAALYSFRFAQPFAKAYISNPLLANIAAGLILFIVFLILFSTLSRLLSNTIKHSALNGVDHSLGLLFGVIRGGLIVIGLFFLSGFVWTGAQKPLVIKSSKSLPYLLHGENFLKLFLPEGFLPKDIKTEGLKALKEHGTSVLEKSREETLQQLAENLSAPKPALNSQPKAPEEQPKGYRSNQQSEMNRLFQNYSGNEKEKTSDNP